MEVVINLIFNRYPVVNSWRNINKKEKILTNYGNYVKIK